MRIYIQTRANGWSRASHHVSIGEVLSCAILPLALHGVKFIYSDGWLLSLGSFVGVHHKLVLKVADRLSILVERTGFEYWLLVLMADRIKGRCRETLVIGHVSCGWHRETASLWVQMKICFTIGFSSLVKIVLIQKCRLLDQRPICGRLAGHLQILIFEF